MSRPRGCSWNRPRGATTGGSWRSAGGGSSGVRGAAEPALRLVSELAGHQNKAVAVRFLPGTPFLLSNSLGRVVRVWDPVAGRQLLQCRGVHPGVHGGRFADRRERGRQTGRVPGRAAARSPRPAPRGGREPARAGPGMSPACRSTHRRAGLATGGLDGVRFWDLARGSRSRWLPLPGGCTAQFVGPDNRALVTHGVDRVLVVAAVPGATGVGRSARRGRSRSARRTASLLPSVTPDGEWVSFVPGGDGPAVVRHTADPTRRAVLGPYAPADYVALQPGRAVRGSSGLAKAGVAVWEVATGKLVHRVPGMSLQRPSPRTAGGWPRGSSTTSSSCGTRTAGSRCSRLPEGEGRFAFSADSRLLAVGVGYGKVRMLDARNGRPLVELRRPPTPRRCRAAGVLPGRPVPGGAGRRNSRPWCGTWPPSAAGWPTSAWTGSTSPARRRRPLTRLSPAARAPVASFLACPHEPATGRRS